MAIPRVFQLREWPAPGQSQLGVELLDFSRLFAFISHWCPPEGWVMASNGLLFLVLNLSQ